MDEIRYGPEYDRQVEEEAAKKLREEEGERRSERRRVRRKRIVRVLKAACIPLVCVILAFVLDWAILGTTEFFSQRAEAERVRKQREEEAERERKVYELYKQGGPQWEELYWDLKRRGIKP